MEFCIYFTMDAELKERHISLELTKVRDWILTQVITTQQRQNDWSGLGRATLTFISCPAFWPKRGLGLLLLLHIHLTLLSPVNSLSGSPAFLPALDAGPATSLSPHFCPPYSDTGAIKRALPFELGGESLRNEFQTWPSKVIWPNVNTGFISFFFLACPLETGEMYMCLRDTRWRAWPHQQVLSISVVYGWWKICYKCIKFLNRSGTVLFYQFLWRWAKHHLG
jgi:hypothetical protein